MKNLLGLMVVILIFGYIITREDENGESTMSKQYSEDGVRGNVKLAEEAASIYGNASVDRIEAEFGEDGGY